MKEQKFYICEHCGNIVVKVHDAGVPVFCCGQKMTELVPGAVDAVSSAGCNELIARGAKLVRDARDVLEEYAGSYTFANVEYEEPPVEAAQPQQVSKKAAAPKKQTPPAAVGPTLADVYGQTPEDTGDPVLNALEGILPLEELSRRTGIDTPTLLGKLTLLELQGKVRQLPGQNYEKN